MITNRIIGFIATCCACFAVSSLNAATIPAGTTLAVQTASSISSQDPAGRSFAAQLDRDVTVKGQVTLRRGLLDYIGVPPGGQIEVSARSSGDELVVSVRDTGEGIAAEHLPNVFDRFGERTQSQCKDERLSAGKPHSNGTTGTVWTYCRHVNGYSWNQDAVPTDSTAQPVTEPSSHLILQAATAHPSRIAALPRLLTTG